MKPKLIITTGDPSGCGPSITLQAIADSDLEHFTVIGDAKILKRYPLFSRLRAKIDFVDLDTPEVNSIKAGYPSEVSGRASLNYLNKAIELLGQDSTQALVTAPVSKEAIARIVPDFCGHTDFLAQAFAVNLYAMLMEAGDWRVVLLTRHIPLAQVSQTLNKNLIKNNLSLISGFLQKYHQFKQPKIAVSSFNPHAGVNTFLAGEEKIIAAAIAEVPELNIFGPYPADTLFLPQNLKRYHCLMALYHDQGMIPFKMLAFRHGVNVTVGLPFVRTSPAHGVALELMRQNKRPLHSSMLAAIKEAVKLCL